MAANTEEQKAKKAADEAQAQDEAVVDTGDNAKLEHSQGGATTKDTTDVGVPMLAGDPSEPVGPEDALGEGPKRGDYRDRIHTQATTMVPNPNAGEPITDDDGNTLDYQPSAIPVDQVPRAEDIGEVAGEKGGVTTA